MDEKVLLSQIQMLAHKLFIANPDGQQFIKLMKLLHVTTPTFPQSVDTLNRHGGPIGWSAFREGQITLLRSLEILGQNYLDRVQSETKEKA